MAHTQQSVRTSITLTSKLAGRVRRIARNEKTSINKVVIHLIEEGLEAREQERKRFFELAQRLTESNDPSEQRRLKQELAKMTFGE